MCIRDRTQYARQGRLVRSIRFTTEVLSGVPSIIFGLFGFTFFCVMLRLGTSILAGCLTMSICILPTIVRTTEAVSYTHLDVYKRQDHVRPVCAGDDGEQCAGQGEEGVP